ncbi:MAG TPA: YtxH domain-containing protein [Actinomycetes bacterium]
MRTKATFLAGLATGYVLGSRAGRARYEQIRQAARAFASNPAVQNATSQLQHTAGDVLVTAKDKASSKLGDKLGDRRPAWLGASGTSTSGAPDESGWAAGSNGHIGG